MKKSLVILFILTLTFSVIAVESPYIEESGGTLTSIKLYNSEKLDKSVELELSSYQFKKSQTARVSWELLFSYKKLSRECELPIAVVYHKADSTVIFRNNFRESIEKDWDWSTSRGGWGWDEKDNWHPGNYFIYFWAGDVYLGKKDFEIVNDLELFHIEPLNAFVESLKLFNLQEAVKVEGGLLYKTSFKQQYIKDIGWDLKLRHIETKPCNFEIRCKFFDSKGKELSNQITPTMTQKDRFTSRHMGSWGVPIMGRWNQGKYRVELYIDNVMIATAPFEIIP